MGIYHNFAEYNPVHKVVIFGGGNSSAEIPGGDKTLYKINANGAITRQKQAPIPLGIHKTVITVDPVSGDYLVLAANRQFYKYDVVTDTWAQLSFPTILDPVQIDSTTITAVAATPVNNYGVVMLVKYSTSGNSGVFLYRHAAGTGTPVAPPPVDTTAPSVPSGVVAAAVSGSQITLSWNPSSDDVGVAGYRVYRNGVQIGTANTPSYSDSGLAGKTTYGYTVAGYDEAGNVSAASAPVSTTTFSSGIVSTPTGSDFQTKCVQPGVIKCFGFDSPSELYYAWPTGTACDAVFAGRTNYGFGPPRTGPGNTIATIANGECVYPVIDTNIRSSGAGSLKMTIPSKSGPTTSGSFTELFDRYKDGTFPYIAPGSPLGNVLYFQFKQRMDSVFTGTDYRCGTSAAPEGCGGWKQVILYGDPPRTSSSDAFSVVLNNGNQRDVPQMYGHTAGGSGFTSSFSLDPNHTTRPRNCSYTNAAGSPNGTSGFASRPSYRAPYNPGCLHFTDYNDQWVEYTISIEVCAPSNAPCSRVQQWVNGILNIDVNNYTVNYGTWAGRGYGAFELTPYHTRKDPTHVHPVGYTWYDDVIISTQPIRMSGSSGNAPAAPSNVSIIVK
jgi:hypothetical protein